MSQTVELLAIIGSVTALLGWTIKHVLSYFFTANTDFKNYIKELVTTNQSNVIEFTNTINHQRTLDREMNERNAKAIEGLTVEIKNTNEINSKILEFLSGR